MVAAVAMMAVVGEEALQFRNESFGAVGPVSVVSLVSLNDWVQTH